MNIFFASCGDCCLGFQSGFYLMILNCIGLLIAKSVKWQVRDLRKRLDSFVYVV